MVDDTITQFPKTLSQMHSMLIDWKQPLGAPKKSIQVDAPEDIWIIKVNKDRCPVCGTVEKSKADWCDPRPESWWE